jgi:hypothetical protein
LLRAILSHHPDLFIPPENGTLGQMMRTFGAYRTAPWNDVVTAVLKDFRENYDFENWDIDLTLLAREVAAFPPERRNLSALINYLYSAYGRIHAPGKTRWGDKTPLNSFYLDRIALVYPNAQYIHILRDGRDCVCSFVKAGMWQKDYILAAYGWRDSVRRCRRFGRQPQYQNRYFEIRYEDLVSCPEQKVPELCQFLGIEPTEQMLHFGGSIGHVSDVTRKAHHKNLSKPISRDSVGAWKEQIPKAELPSVLRILRKELSLAGYEGTRS